MHEQGTRTDRRNEQCLCAATERVLQQPRQLRLTERDMRRRFGLSLGQERNDLTQHSQRKIDLALFIGVLLD